MRQTTPRRPPETVTATTIAETTGADTTGADLRVGAGGHLDLGMIVSVYGPGSAGPAKDGTPALPAHDAGPCFTEH